MMNLLLAVDGSECSARAVTQAIALTGQLAEAPRLHLLHVHLPIPIGRIQAHVGHDQLQAYYREEGESQLAFARGQLEQAGLVFTPHIHVGQPAEVIAHQARELDCDLIVMGSHGRTGLSGLVMGSVAGRVLHLAHCPVLLTK